jgi:hypothetical protein
MNVFMLGLRVTESSIESDGKTNVIAECLPNSEKRVATTVQLIQKSDHYVGKLLNSLSEGQTILAIGPTKETPDRVLQMMPMLIVTKENFDDLLALNLFMATGGLGPKTEEVEFGDNTVTNRSIAWKKEEEQNANWFKLTAWGELSKQLSELAPGTPTIAVGKVSCSEKDDKQYLNYNVDKILYLPKGTKAAPKKAADPDKGRVASAAIGSVEFSL